MGRCGTIILGVSGQHETRAYGMSAFARQQFWMEAKQPHTGGRAPLKPKSLTMGAGWASSRKRVGWTQGCLLMHE